MSENTDNVLKELEQTQRAFLQLQIENAQLKLTILDLRKTVAASAPAEQKEQ